MKFNWSIFLHKLIEVNALSKTIACFVLTILFISETMVFADFSELNPSRGRPTDFNFPLVFIPITSVWDIECQEWCDSVLFLLYTGSRIGEMLTIEKANVDLEQMTVKGGIKTKAGKDRIVPIHPRIQKFVKHRMTETGKYLFSYNGKKLSTSQYYIFWNRVMDELKIHHTPHECRHTFRSRLDSAGANKVCIDLMMGHKSKEVGERVYTHKTIEELKEAINLLK